MLDNKCLAVCIMINILMSFLSISSTQFQIANSQFDSNSELAYQITNQPLFLNGIYYLDYYMFTSFLGGDAFMNVGNFTKFIETYLIPANIQFVGLSVGWEQHANTTFSDIAYQKWVDDFLSIADRYKINVFFHFGSWRPLTITPSWWHDTVKARPEILSSLKNGTIAMEGNPLIIDSPIFLEQLKEDIIQLYQYYGKHDSWVGIAFGNTTYAPLDDTLVDWGFDEFTVFNFFNSVYYQRDVNSTGHHPDGGKDKLWEMFMENQPLIKIKSGNLQRWSWSSPLDIYGGKNGSCVAIKFRSPENLESFQVLLYGHRTGNPKELVLELYEDENDFPKRIGNPLEIVQQPSHFITTSRSWQTAINFTSHLIKNNYYWILLRSEGNASNKYFIYRGEYRIDDETHIKFSKNGYGGRWDGYGSAFIILRDSKGKDVFVRPFREIYEMLILDRQVIKQSFIAPSNTSVNAIWLCLADRAMANDPRSLPVALIRTSDNFVVAEGELGINCTKGTFWWSMISLNKRVNLTRGEKYEIKIGPAAKDCLPWRLLAERVDPAEYGFQGKHEYLLFALADMSIDPFLVSYSTPLPIELTNDRITWTDWMAIGFKTTKTSKLQNLSIKIVKIGSPGDLRISLYDDEETISSSYGLSKPKNELESLTISDSEIPSDGWLQTSGWKTTINASARYWIVLSQTSKSDGEYRVYRKRPNYFFPFVSSTDSGSKWRWGFTYTNSPGEPLLKICTVDEIINNEPWEIKSFSFKDRNWIAQSFILNNKTFIRGVNIWLLQAFDSYNNFTLEIRTDEYDAPSKMILAKSVFKPGYGLFSGSSLALADFDFTIELRPGKYWIVIKSLQGFTPIVLWEKPRYSFGAFECKVKITRDGGLTWTLPEGRDGDLIFSLVKSPTTSGYNINEIAEEIKAYHVYDINREPLRGWNVYLNVQTSKIQKELIQWFESYTGRRLFSIDPNPPKIIQEVQGEKQLLNILEINDFLSINKSASIDKMAIINRFLEFPQVTIIPMINLKNECFDLIEIYHKKITPIVPKPVVLLNIDNIRLLDRLVSFIISRLSSDLERLSYVGEYFGKESGVISVLFIGNKSSLLLAQYLTSTINVTFCNLNYDYNLSRFDDFKSFDVIVWASDKESMERVTKNAQIRIKEFINKGGGIVIINSWAKWADNITGLSFIDEKITPSPLEYVNYSHPILKPYMNITKSMLYSHINKVIPVSTNISYVVKDLIGQPIISVNKYGQGLCIFYDLPSFDKIVSAHAIILNNAVFYVANKQEVLPVLWYDNFKEKTHLLKDLEFSLTGKFGGPLLLFISNNGPTTTFDIYLNSSFYGLDPDAWIAFDAGSWLPISKGQGTEVKISIRVLNMSSYSIYILNDTKEFHTLYSNFRIIFEQIYPNQAICKLEIVPSRTAWLVVRSPKEVKTVIIDDNDIERKYSLYRFDISYGRGQWFYDYGQELLYIRTKGDRDSKLRIIFETRKSIFSFLKEYIYVLFILLILSAIMIELFGLKMRKTLN